MTGGAKSYVDIRAQGSAKSYEELRKFNPYHDAKGLFSTANGAASFTYAPGKSRAHDLAIAREKARMAAMNTPPPKDPKMYPDAIAGVKRGKEMTFDEADHGQANPNFSKGGGYTTNCQTCVVAYEARLRGYDVRARSNTPGSKLRELSLHTNRAWIDPATGKPPKYIVPSTSDSVTTPKRVVSWLEKTLEEGGRYTIQFNWKGRRSSGHIVSIKKGKSGQLSIFDPQTGKKTNGTAKVERYFNNVKLSMTIAGRKFLCPPRVLRVDDKQFNMSFADAILKGVQNGQGKNP